MVKKLVSLLFKMGLYERRKYVRVSIKLPVTLEMFNNEHLAGHINNLSAGGVFIKTKKEIPSKSEFTIKFSLPGKNFKEPITGRLVWHKEASGFYENGIEFTSISDEDRNLILNYEYEKNGISKNE